MTPEEEVARWPQHALVDRRSTKQERQSMGEFVEWLAENGIVLAKLDEQYGADYVRVFTPTSELIARYLGVDYKAYQAETEDMLTYLREQLKQAEK